MKFIFVWNGNYYFSLFLNVENYDGSQCQVISKDICKKHNYMFTVFRRGFCLNEYEITGRVVKRINFKQSGLV